MFALYHNKKKDFIQKKKLEKFIDNLILYIFVIRLFFRSRNREKYNSRQFSI